VQLKPYAIVLGCSHIFDSGVRTRTPSTTLRRADDLHVKHGLLWDNGPEYSFCGRCDQGFSASRTLVSTVHWARLLVFSLPSFRTTTSSSVCTGCMFAVRPIVLHACRLRTQGSSMAQCKCCFPCPANETANCTQESAPSVQVGEIWNAVPGQCLLRLPLFHSYEASSAVDRFEVTAVAVTSKSSTCVSLVQAEKW